MGDRVLLVKLRGVSSPSLRAQVGKVGIVVEVHTGELGTRVLVAFEVSWKEFDRFWLRESELEPVPEEASA